jgi:hypothetical protein
MKKIRKIWGIGLVVVLLVSLFGLAAPASAGTLAWGAESIPGTTNNILAPVDVKDIAVADDGMTIWAAPGSTKAGYVFKSTDGGESWTAVTESDLTGKNLDLIAIAPDDSDMVVAAASDTQNVYITTNAGSTWSSLGTVQELPSGGAAAMLTDLALSATSAGTNYVAVSGYESGNVANLWYFNIGAAAPVWKETNTKDGFNTSSTNSTGAANTVAAVAFSPNFPSDKVLTAIIANTGASGNVTWEIFSLAQTKWNQAAGTFDSYPDSFISANIASVDSADISLSPTYLGSDDTERVGFSAISLTLGSGTDTYSGIWRHKDVSEKQLKAVTAHSVAFDGTNLVAGAYDTNIVYRSADPLATTPTVSSARSLKRPGIDTSGVNEMAVVSWAGGNVVAGTSGDESAFAVSTDDGMTFNDISLIDTTISNATDIAVTADGSVVYFVTDDSSDTSLWLNASSWKRILTLKSDTGFIVRTAPDNPEVVYVAKKGSTTLYYSSNGGLEKWFSRTCNLNIQDLAVESEDVVYALENDGDVSKSTNGGFTFATAKSNKLGNGYSLVSVSEDVLLSGGTDGYVSYSTDGNTSWTKLNSKMEAGATNMLVAADTNFADNNLIYCATTASNHNIRKWEIGTSTSWSDIFINDVPATDEATIIGGVFGLATIAGNLYAVEFDTADSQSSLWQCLSPTTATSTSSSWEEKRTTSTTDTSDTTVSLGTGSQSPNAMVASAGSNKLWTVKTNGTNKLYSFTDTLAAEGPTLLGPGDGFSNPVNVVTGKANEISFSWSRLSTSTEYKLYIAYDSSFTESVTSYVKESSSSTVAVPVGPDRSGGQQANWLPGRTYYWRVKSTQPLYSAYSETRAFVIEPGAALVPTIMSPNIGATGLSKLPSFSWSPVSGTTEYQFVLADNVALSSPIVDAIVTSTGYALVSPLEYGETYYWAVKPLAPVEGNWSAIANFTVMEEPKPTVTTPPVTITQVPAPTITIPPVTPPPDIVIPPAPQPPAPIAPAYIWAIIIIGAVLVIAVIVLIVRTRRSV